jgi:hypothetical protein
MFGKLLDVTTTRSVSEAIVFYTISTMLLVGISTVLVHVLGLMGVIDGTVGFFTGSSIHTLIGTGFVLFLSGLILSHKNLTSDLLSIVVTVIGLYMSFTSSVLIGMLLVAYLTTLNSRATS